METVQSVGFWGGFLSILAVSLIIGGFVKSYPNFAVIVLISLLLAIVGGFVGQAIAVNKAKASVSYKAKSLFKNLTDRLF